MFKNFLIGFTLLSAMTGTAFAQPPWWRPQDLPGLGNPPRINDRTPSRRPMNHLWWIRIHNTNNTQWIIAVDGQGHTLAPGQTQTFSLSTHESMHIFTIDFGGRSPAHCRAGMNLLLVLDADGGHVQAQ